MLENKYRNWSVILADPQMLGLVSASVISRILDAMLEPNEQFLPIEERASQKQLPSREQQDGLGRLVGE